MGPDAMPKSVVHIPWMAPKPSSYSSLHTGWRTSSKALPLLPQQASMGLMGCTSPHLAPQCGHQVLCRAVRSQHLLWLHGLCFPVPYLMGSLSHTSHGAEELLSSPSSRGYDCGHLYPLSRTTLATLRQQMLGRCPGPGCDTVAAEHRSVNAEKNDKKLEHRERAFK